MTDVATPLQPDILAVSDQQWSVRELAHFTGNRETHFQAVFKQSVLDQIHIHGQSSADIEVCGVVVGNVHQDAQGPYLLIQNCIRGSGAASRATNVTFTAETWQHIQETMDRDYPDQKILGWYHTHPGFGIFLSDMDLFICDNFFNLPFQIAFVYDPQSGEDGNFIWRNGKPTREPILIENDVTPEAAKIPLISKSEAMEQPAGEERPGRVPVILRDPLSDQINELRYRVHKLERRQQLYVASLAFLTAFVAFWAVGMNPAAPANSASNRAPFKPTTGPTPLTLRPADQGRQDMTP
jgi:proteasome lid subunit RPN8/RPN11